LKIIFKENFDYHDFLKPINVREEPEELPIIDVSQIDSRREFRKNIALVEIDNNISIIHEDYTQDIGFNEIELIERKRGIQITSALFRIDSC
jgi:hypothetical protein